jgi:hypothetical protein
MKKSLTAVLIMAVAALAATVAQANPITGSVGFAGDVSLNGTLTSATAITGFTDVKATTMSGDYTDVVFNTPAVLVPFSFNPSSTTPKALWLVNGLTETWSFEVSSIVLDFQGPSGIVVSGLGTAYEDGGNATPGTWSIDISQNGASVTFGSTAATVPDGAVTLSLFSGTLLGLGALRRKLGC